MSIEAMKLALAALETCRIRSVSEWSVEDITPKNVTAAIAALRTAIQQAEAQQPATAIACGIPGMAKTTCPYCEQGFAFEHEQPATGQVILPDGSAFAIASFPLPKDHWLYAPREYATSAEEPLELPVPILTHGQREAVVAAIRYAVRGATMCGRERDFDPDAMVQNAVYALCGPHARASAENTQMSVNLALAQQPTTGEPVAWMASYVDPIGNDHVYVTSHHDLAVENDMHGTPRPLYTHPAPSVPADVVRDAERYRWLRETTNSFTNSQGERIDVKLHPGQWDAAIDAAMLAAKDTK